MSSAIDIRPFERSDQPAVLELLTRSLGAGPAGVRSAAFFEWKHWANPFGPSPAFVAVTDGKIVGFRIFLRWRWRAGDTTVRAVRAVDTATDPEYQGAGIFTRLTRAAIEAVTPTTDLIFNTPNSSSLPGYLKMGWSSVGRVPVAIRPVRPLRFLRGLRSAGEGGAPVDVAGLASAAEILADAEGVARLLKLTADGDGRLTTDRSASFLQWRYAEAPGLAYRAVELRTGDGDLQGVAIGRMRQRGALVEFALAELLVARGDRAAARHLLKAVTRSGCDHITAVTELDPSLRSVYRRRGFLPAPSSQGVVFVANPLRELTPDPTELRSWAFSLGDLEVF